MKLLFLAFWFHLTYSVFKQQKSIFLTADSFQHNTFHLQNSSQYLFDKHCIENNFMHSKATNDKKTESGGKNICLLFFAFPPCFGLQIFFHPCIFLEPCYNSLPSIKVSRYLIPFLERKSPSQRR